MNPEEDNEIEKLLDRVIDKIINEEGEEGLGEKSTIDLLLNKSIRLANLEEFELSPYATSTGRIGTRSQKNIVHTQLENPPKRVKGKKMADSKPLVFSFSEALNMIPKYLGETEIRPFIDTVEAVMGNVETNQIPFLVKMISTTKLINKAYNTIRYRETTNWENIKQLLLDAFETPYAAGHLQIELNLIKMGATETINGYNNRVESIFQKLCSALTAGKSEEAAFSIKDTVKKQAIISYIEGLKETLKFEVKISKPNTLEHAMQEAIVADKNITNNLRIHELATGGNPGINNNYNNFGRNNIGRTQINGNRNNFGGNNNNFRGNRGNYNNNNNFQNNRGNNNNIGRATKCFSCGRDGHRAADCRS